MYIAIEIRKEKKLVGVGFVCTSNIEEGRY